MKLENITIKDSKTFNAQYKAVIKALETELKSDSMKDNKNFDTIRSKLSALKKKKIDNEEAKYFQMERIVEILLGANVIDLKIKKAVSELDKL